MPEHEPNTEENANGEEIYKWSLDEKDQLNEALEELSDLIACSGLAHHESQDRASKYWLQMQSGEAFDKVMGRVSNAFQRAKNQAQPHLVNAQSLADLAGSEGTKLIIAYAHKAGRAFPDRPHFLKNIEPGFVAKALATMQDETKREAFLKFCEEKANEPR